MVRVAGETVPVATIAANVTGMTVGSIVAIITTMTPTGLVRCCHTSSSRRLGGGSCRPWPMRMEVARAAVGSKPWLLILGTELSSLCRETPPGRRKLRPELHAPTSKLRGLKVLPGASGSLEPNTPKAEVSVADPTGRLRDGIEEAAGPNQRAQILRVHPQALTRI